MKIKLFFLFLLLSSLAVNAQIINIPDANFKAKLLSSSPSNTIAKNLSGNYFAIDANGDGEIQQSEAEQVGELEIVDNIASDSYQGLLSFSNVKKIKIQDIAPSNANSLDISNLNFLTDLDIQIFTYSNDVILSVNNCNNLINFTSKPGILPVFSGTSALRNVSINISDTFGPILNDFNNTLTSLEAINGVEKVSLAYGEQDPIYFPLSFNLSNHPNLKEVNINGIGLNKLDLSNCLLLDVVSIDFLGASPNYPFFEEIDISNSPLIVNLNSNTINVKKLTANNNLNLNKISIRKAQNLYLSNCPQLNEIEIRELGKDAISTPMEVINCPNVKTLTLGYQYPTLNATPLINLENLSLDAYINPYYSYHPIFNEELQSLIVNNNANLKTLNIKNYKKLNQLNINGLAKLESVSIVFLSTTFSPIFDFSTDFLHSFSIQNCPLLTTLTLSDQRGLKTAVVKNCPKLVSFANSIYPVYGYSALESLEIDNCAILNTIGVSRNQLTNLKILNCPALKELYAEHNLLNSFDLTNSTASMTHLLLSDNNLTSFNNILSFPNLEILFLSGNRIVDLDLSGHNKIGYFEYKATSSYTTGTQINPSTFLKTVNLNGCSNLGVSVDLESSVLDKVFLKNGVSESLSITNSPSLQYVCVDDNQVAGIQASLALQGFTNVNVNTYCSFVPGGTYNTITGAVRFDENNNGCDTNDEFFEHMKLKINDGTNTGETFVKNDGTYDFYTQAGNFTVTAEPENPTLFTVMQSTFTTSFPNSNNNIFTQNICVTKNGNANDLEVVIAPETNATPGFDAKYKLMWRNKGNTTLSGNVTLTFDSSKMTFMSSVLPYASIVGNQITFNFSNLKPYANTASEIIFKINTPTHPTNPVNSGDILNFSAVVNPLAGDFKPEDNSFSYKQTVVNSFDPNDIVCMEGNSIPQSMVGKFLHYIVNFENTGTAPATNIVVEMDIDPNDFDISTLQLQNASHQVYTKVKNNKVEFIMEYANLGNGGHGNILMKILSKNTLASGDNVNNKANIYFDYNFPIVTNDAVTTIESSSVLQTTEAKIDNSITIYPIPTKGEVNINADSKISSIEVFDIQGRIIQKQIGINNQSTKLTIHSSSTGVFLFKVNTEKGILMKKVIKN